MNSSVLRVNSNFSNDYSTHLGFNTKLDWVRFTSANLDYIREFAPVIKRYLVNLPFDIEEHILELLKYVKSEQKKTQKESAEEKSSLDILEEKTSAVKAAVFCRLEFIEGLYYSKNHNWHLLDLSGKFWSLIHPSKHAEFLSELQKVSVNLEKHYPTPTLPSKKERLSGKPIPSFYDVRVFCTRIDFASDIFVKEKRLVDEYVELLRRSCSITELYKNKYKFEFTGPDVFKDFPSLSYQLVMPDKPINPKRPSMGRKITGICHNFGKRGCTHVYRIYDKTLELTSKVKELDDKVPKQIVDILSDGRSLWRWEYECHRRFEFNYMFFTSVDNLMLKLNEHGYIFFPYVQYGENIEFLNKVSDDYKKIHINSHYTKWLK